MELLHSTWVIGLSISALLLMLSWFTFSAKGSKTLKALVVTLSGSLGLIAWAFSANLLGWPADVDLPQTTLVHSIVVEEPDAIILMGSDLEPPDVSIFDPPFVNLSGPRLYKLPYTREGHQQAEAIRQMLEQGQQVILSQKGLDGEPGNGNNGNGNADGNGDSGGGEGAPGDSPPLGFIMPKTGRLPDK